MGAGTNAAAGASTPPHARVIGALAFCAEAIVIVTIIVNILVTFSNALVRYLLHQDFPWATDVSAILISIITFIGAPAYFRRSSGMAYTALIDRLEGHAKDTLEACGLSILLGVCLTALAAFPAFFAGQRAQTLAVLDISTGYVAIWLGVGLALLALFAAEKLAALSPRAALRAMTVVAAIAIVAAVLRWAYARGHVEIDPFILILPALLFAFLAGTPVAGILALGGILFFVVTGDAPITVIPQAMQYGVSSFVLLAIPFFMVAGVMMEITGMAKRMVDMVQAWVGHWTGGLLMAEVLATYMFSGVSGSKAADVATIGSVMKGPMRNYGYPSTEFVAVLAASAAMAETVPPSVAMLILGSVTSISVGALFIAGFLPAAILAVMLIIGVIIRSRINNYHKGPPFNLRAALKSIPPALPAAGVPIMVIGGLVGGIASPTESAAFAVVYGFAAALVVYRSLGAGTFITALREATLVAGMVLLMVSTSNLLVQAIVVDGLGRTLGGAFAAIDSATMFLFLSVAALIVLGFVLEGFPAILIAAPIFLPVASKLGVDPLQFGILLIMATGIGVMMPPVGIGYYISCAVGEAPVNATIRPSLFYNVFLILGLAIVILFPQITLWLPHQFGLR
jgi:tripartite ATP-independent transporter DctM subunit